MRLIQCYARRPGRIVKLFILYSGLVKTKPVEGTLHRSYARPGRCGRRLSYETLPASEGLEWRAGRRRPLSETSALLFWTVSGDILSWVKDKEQGARP